MKTPLLATVLLASLAFAAPGAYAKGCIKGAAVGGVAGHFVHHHGLLGATAGCLIGRHHANKEERVAHNERHTVASR
ncbi:hypothetical protein HHL11_25985 [Ramlibacter sp. G-1-2-2]|uniref:Glycine zipper 2TM domain-containing protein n=1 Tax=Ramlibacter agri TaxID=2728837 RepID=A0A848H9Q9_9BURK|nr:hypothetical protein [Ramlibacter agri]NML47224.1 hypothetical protein [Ramlibacter agri]